MCTNIARFVWAIVRQLWIIWLIALTFGAGTMTNPKTPIPTWSSSSDGSSSSSYPPPSPPGTNNFNAAVTQFTIAMYSAVSQTMGGNLIMSPLSAQLDLGMLSFGAQGQTVQDLQSALKLPNEPEATIQAYFNGLVRNLTTESNLKLADAIYVSNKYEIQNTFTDTGRYVFDAQIEPIDFNNPVQASNIMNNWVASKTNNEIKHLTNPSDISPSTEIVLLNTLYFADRWVHQFQESATKKSVFFPNGGCSDIAIEVDMMQNTEYYGYGNISSLNAGVVPLGCVDTNIQMYIILPNEGCGGLEQTEAALKNLNLAELNSQIEFNKVRISLPRFTINSNLNLNSALEQMGFQSLFDGTADLGGIVKPPAPPVSVSKVIQSAHIEVNEKGVHASAATAIMGVGAIYWPHEPVRFNVNRPFLYLIASPIDILFIGRVTNPNLVPA